MGAESESRFVRSPACVTRQIAGAMLVVPVRSSAADLDSIYTLNGVGAFVWNRLDGRSTAAEIAAAVAEEFSAVPAAVKAEVEGFIGRLQALGLVEPRGDGR